MQRKWKRRWQRLTTIVLPPVAVGLMLLSTYSPALANPTGGTVASGSAAIQTSGNTMTINQSSNKAIINWQNFSIASGEKVQFIQPGATSVALNRVIGNNASSIYGTLTANGKVYLINPNGILFAHGSSVNVGGLVASTLNIADSDFLNGKYTFSGNGGSVINQGNITATNEAVFFGPQVANEGVIAAKVAGLAAGSKVSLDFSGDSLLNVSVDTAMAGNSVTNSGSILADGGLVVMTTGTKDALLSTVVNNSGVIRAQTVDTTGGVIKLIGGTIHVGGTLDASAPKGGDGGFIETSGGVVQGADGTKVTTLAASGKAGTWLIDPTNFTISSGGAAQTGSGIGADTLATSLASGNVTLATDNTSGSNAGDINVNSAVTWDSANTLTLSAYRNININSSITATNAGGKLSLLYNQGGSGGDYYIHAPVNLQAGPNFSTKYGSAAAITWTVITALGTAASSNDGTLQGIQGNLSGHYFLGANIDASATSTWNSAGFTPIGNNSSANFTGSFDGGGHTISGLTINRPSTTCAGLFGATSSTADIRNVGLVDGSVTGGSNVGSLVGNNQGRVTNSYNGGSVSG